MKKFLFSMLALTAFMSSKAQNYIGGPTGVYGSTWNAATTIDAAGSVTVGTGGNWGFGGGGITALAKNTATGSSRGITFTGGGTYSNAGAAPMINGYATSVSSALALPVADAVNTRSVTLAANTATVSTAWFALDPNTSNDPSDGSTHTVNRASVDPSINGVSKQGFWDWISSAPVTSTFSMPDMSTEAASPADVRLLGWNGSMWTDLGAPAPASLAAGTPVTASVPAGITAVTMGSTQYLLPVTLLSFNAVPAGDCSTQLKWATATETNSSKYIIEYSAGGSNYTPVGEVSSKNNSTGATYTYTVSSLANGAATFRLKMVDKDGGIAYSNTRAVTIACVNGKIAVTPNPVKDRIIVRGMTGLNNTIRIYSVSGQLLAAKVTGNATETLNAAGYAAGTYLVVVTDAKGNKLGAVKVVKE